jgi:hypothetical protein
MDNFLTGGRTIHEYHQKQDKPTCHPDDLQPLLTLPLEEIIVQDDVIEIVENLRCGVERNAMLAEIRLSFLRVPGEPPLHLLPVTSVHIFSYVQTPHGTRTRFCPPSRAANRQTDNTTYLQLLT